MNGPQFTSVWILLFCKIWCFLCKLYNSATLLCRYILKKIVMTETWNWEPRSRNCSGKWPTRRPGTQEVATWPSTATRGGSSSTQDHLVYWWVGEQQEDIPTAVPCGEEEGISCGKLQICGSEVRLWQAEHRDLQPHPFYARTLQLRGDGSHQKRHILP